MESLAPPLTNTAYALWATPYLRILRETVYLSDWTPTLYNPDKLTLPHFLPDTPGTRKELSNLYTMASRVDQG